MHLRPLRARLSQHLGREVEPPDIAALADKAGSQVTGADAEVKHSKARPCIR